MKQKNIKRAFIKSLFIGLLIVSIPKITLGEKITLFYNSSKPQHVFAAIDIKKALESKSFTVEIKDLLSLTKSYKGKKVVIALAADSPIVTLLTSQGGSTVDSPGEQAYALRTTTAPSLSYWIFGGDDNGAMYGGLQIAENINFNGFSGTYNNQESPYILQRGVKLNLALDAACPTYNGTSSGSSYKNSIPNTWDTTFWKTWFDEMARKRYNLVSVWVDNPFSAIIQVPGFPNAYIKDVTGYDGFFKIMSYKQKIDHWRFVMDYAHSRGFSFYFFNWNIRLDGVENIDGIGLTRDMANTKSNQYLHDAMNQLLETYPNLDGFGVMPGEAFPKNATHDQIENWLWNQFGKPMNDYAVEHPSRKLTFLHRYHGSDIDAIANYFLPLRDLPNTRFHTSFKISDAHMYSTTTPNGYANSIAGIAKYNLKTFLTLRNDDFYYLQWADPVFARAYIAGFPEKDKFVAGVYIGSDGYSPTRTFFCKNSAINGQLEIQRKWYMEMLWGRLLYNPNTSDDVFKKSLALKYPQLSSEDLFTAWSKVSRSLPKVTELVGGDWNFDFEWYPEGCWATSGQGPFKKIAAMGDCRVAPGSNICSIASSASGSCSGKKSSYDLAAEMETDASNVLSIVNSMSSGGNPDLDAVINNIKQMAYLSNYYAYKIRGATYKKANQTADAQTAMGKAYCWWIHYTNSMDAMYTGMDMQRVEGIPNWHWNDAAVLKEYTDLGGSGTPNCSDVAVEGNK